MIKHLIPLVMIAGCTVDVAGTTEPSQDSDPWPVLDRIEREGPPRYTSRVHSCAKMRYLTLGNVLASRGVNLAGTADTSAGKIYSIGKAGLGGGSLLARVRENVEVGLATESKIFDIFVEAAPEIIASMPSRTECQKSGVGVTLFDAAGKCQLDGISCLTGIQATQLQVDVCNQTVAKADDIEHGKQLAVAVLAAAAHTCE
ncbi:MAG TPA: hypothetical protein VGO00_22670 [Kofleriaceae bacterium]|jgi:hypothetical protein|nr:hypothetical protein [Kofleriaceae bacterium]